MTSLMANLPELLQHEQPDRGHEALRLAFLEALNELANSSVSMDQFRVALQTLNNLATSYVAAVADSRADRQSLHDTDAQIMALLTALTLRVVTLEQKPAVRNVAVAPPVALGLLSIGSRDITLQLDRTLPDTTWEPEYWPSPGLLGSATFTTKSKTTNAIVVTVRNTALIAAGGSLGAIAVRTA